MIRPGKMGLWSSKLDVLQLIGEEDGQRRLVRARGGSEKQADKCRWTVLW